MDEVLEGEVLQETQQLPAVRGAQVPAGRMGVSLAPKPATDQAGPPAVMRDPCEGIGMVPITEAERAVLGRKPDPDKEVAIRPDGIIYTPGVFIRRRLDEAFHPGGWGLRQEGPCGYDAATGETYYDGSLWIHGKYAARAVGGCQWRPTNETMTKTDALEGARTACLTRCAKDLGIASDLWEPRYVADWKAKHAETYHDPRSGKMRWRLREGRVSADVEAAHTGEGPATPRAGTPEGTSEAHKCPKCKEPMELRNGSKGQFWGCVDFKTKGCKGTMNHAPKPAPVEDEQPPDDEREQPLYGAPLPDAPHEEQPLTVMEQIAARSMARFPDLRELDQEERSVQALAYIRALIGDDEFRLNTDDNKQLAADILRDAPASAIAEAKLRAEAAKRF